MKRRHLFEWEDQPWFPHAWRNYMTDLLQFTFTKFAWRAPKTKELLGELLDRMGTDTIVDLCSGSSGPLVWLRAKLEEERGRPVQVILTDKFPNLAAFRALAANSGGRFRFREDSIDATAVPADLAGIRTLFLAFHHFRPEQARAILRSAVEQGRAIAVFEAAERDWKALLLMPLIPLIVWVVTPAVRPVTLGRVFWTYLIPVVPLAVWWDGVVSCLRSYTVKELREMAENVEGKRYIWKAGKERVMGTPGVFTYLIGFPSKSA